MAMANHAAAGQRQRSIASSPPAAPSANRAILQVMANVFGADVYRLDVENSAALGAALRAFHADRLAAGEPMSWKTVVSGFTDPQPGIASRRIRSTSRCMRNCARDYAILERLHQDRSAVC